MSDCCNRTGYQTVFSDRFARRVARTYRKRGLDRTQRRMASFLTDRGIKDASVLEIGGGGEMQIELLSRGAREATNLEISRSYETQAAALLARSGMTDRVRRRFVDIATSPTRSSQLMSWCCTEWCAAIRTTNGCFPRPPAMPNGSSSTPIRRGICSAG